MADRADEWTTETPTQPGYYWWRRNALPSARLYMVRIKERGGRLCVVGMRDGLDNQPLLPPQQTEQWAGPIHTPVTKGEPADAPNPADPWADLTDDELSEVCLCRQHDYRLLEDGERTYLRNCCRDWFDAIRKVRGGDA